MSRNRRKYDSDDKHSHIRYLLAERCRLELDNGDYDNSNLIARDFLWLYPDDRDGINKLKSLFTTIGNKLFDEKNRDEIHNFITPLIESAPFVTDSFEKQVISSLAVDLEEHYTSLALKHFLNGQYQSAMPYCSFVLLLNMNHQKARLLNYMIHRSIFADYQQKSGNYALSESYYLAFERNLLLVTVIQNLVRKGVVLFIDKIVGHCELKRKRICFRNVKPIKGASLVRIGYTMEQEDVSMVITRLDEECLFNVFYLTGSRKTQVKLEDFVGNDLSNLFRTREISPEEYETTSVAC